MISILLPVHNEGEFLSDAITSILNQTYKNWELIIVNNGSTDTTQEIIDYFSKIDNRIKAYYLEEKHKVKSHNFAFNQSSGEIVCFFCGDDMLPINSLAERVEKLLSSESENLYSTCLLKTFSENKNFDGNVFPKNPLLPNYSAGSIMFKREIANKIFPIPLILPNEDTWSQLHLRAFCDIIHIPKTLYNYRIHNNNSYGYGLSYETKRDKFLNRMVAYELFYKKFENENNLFINSYLKSYVKALRILKSSSSPIGFLFIKHLSIAEKLKFTMYSNKLLYHIRNKFFKFFSGISN